MFVPSFLWILVGAPYIERLKDNKLLSSALSSITATVVGVVLNLAVWFSLHTRFGEVATKNLYGFRLLIPDIATVNIAACFIAPLACLLTFYWKKGLAITLGGSASTGSAWFLARSFGLL